MNNLHPTIEAPGWWLTAGPRGVETTQLTDAQMRDRYDPRSVLALALMGAVTVYHDPDRTLLLFDPQAAPRAVLDAAVALAARGPDTVLLRYHWDGWFHRLCPREKLAGVVDDLCLAKNIAVLSMPQVQELDRADVDPLYLDVAQNPVKYRPQMCFFDRRDDGLLHWKFIGPNAPVNSILGRDWARDVVGAPYDTGLYDRDFDRLTAEAYRRVEQSGEPHLSRVTGPLNTPHGIIQQSYTRLIVNVGGQLASFSTIDPVADPRCPAARPSAETRR